MQYINSILNLFHRRLVRMKQFDALLKERQLLEELLKLHTSPPCCDEVLPAECIIFSKDRALQLHALLCSYFEKATNPAPVHILYRTSTAAHEKAYQDVFALFEKNGIFTIKQETKVSFRPQVISILSDLHTGSKVFFLTDDDVFIDDVDLLDFSRSDTRTTVASLRLGGHLKRCYPVQKSQQLPELISCGENAPDMRCWVWASGEHDWSYPLSVNGHLFSTAEVLALAANTEFSSPNTFEANIQVFSKFFMNRLGVCYKRSKILNVPINKVQSDVDNIHGSVHQDFLLEQWNQGMQMDYRTLYGLMNESCHQEVPIMFIKRS